MQILYLSLFIVSFLLSFFILFLLLPRLKKLAKQPIYQEGPKWHIKKEGTPTMGGVAFICAILLCLLFVFIFHKHILTEKETLLLFINTIFILFHGLIGFYDDFKKIRQKQNEGLTPKEKLLYQSILCALYLFARAKLTSLETTISVFHMEIPLGILYYPLALFVMLGIINCANLTDGIDGLASAVAVSIGLFFYLLTMQTVKNSAILSVLMIGSVCAFLLYNKHPAKIFMGDSGSLFLGAASIVLAFSLENPFLILLIGGVYVIEGCSVVLQVLYFKKTKKRLFRMAPLHHHLELSGWKEGVICLLGIGATLLLCTLAFLIQ